MEWKERMHRNGRLWIQSYQLDIHGRKYRVHRLSSEGAPHVAIETAINNEIYKTQKEAAERIKELLNAG